MKSFICTKLILLNKNKLFNSKKFRLCIDDPQKPQTTTKLTEYVFHNTVYPFCLTFVDTPGVPNVKGYNTTSNLIRQWFESQLKEYGHFRLDAISFVAKHNEQQLDWPIIYEISRVKRLFGGSMKSNLLPIITFSEVFFSYFEIYVIYK